MVISDTGKGSVFRFEIPIELGAKGVALKPRVARRVVAPKPGPEAPKILVVDDHLENRDWLMKLLRSIGFSVKSADNGKAALEIWGEWEPQLILMDVHMPVMDGLQATRSIKAHPRGKETIVVVLTASAMDNDRRSVIQSGADDFVAKPCSEDELLEKMRSLLRLAYDYEDISEDASQSEARSKALSIERLGQLPRNLLEEIRSATLTGNKRLLDRLILKVPEAGDTESARALQELADRYDYDSLTRLMEEICQL